MLLGCPVGPPFSPCTMMYEMYVQTEMFIQPIKMEFPYLSAWPGHRSPFLVHRAGDRAEVGAAEGSLLTGTCGPV